MLGKNPPRLNHDLAMAPYLISENNRMPILSKKKAEKSGVAYNNRNAETKRANAEKRMKNQKKATAKALKAFESRGPSKGNIMQNAFARAAENNYKHLHRGGTRRVRRGLRQRG